MRKPMIAFTMGDPGGIGPEVIAKTLKNFKPNQECYTLIAGIPSVFEFLSREHGLSLPLNVIPSLDLSALQFDAINFLDVSDEASKWLARGKKANSLNHFSFQIGKVAHENAAMAFAALEVVSGYAADGVIDAVITAPVNKTAMRLIQPKFHGHTEYLAQKGHAPRFAMMFVHPRLKVTLVTIHVALKKVSRLLNPNLIFEKIQLTDRFLRTYFNMPRPKIGVCALNPHGSETGDEDEQIVQPALKRAREKKIEVAGPLSADRLFYEAYEGRYDAIVSMYHDQGLAPFKMIAFRDGVNVTLGLPFVRTSPDHGTAFDIAYQDKANPSSMKAAYDLAYQLLIPHSSDHALPV